MSLFLIDMLLVMCGGAAVGLCWALYNIAYSRGVAHARQLEQHLRDEHERGRLDARADQMLNRLEVADEDC